MNDIYTKLPLVEFDYPNSISNKMKPRYVRVMKMNDKYIEGYECETSIRFKFKRYSLNRISRSDIRLIEFLPKAS
jgi:hypothetical protein